MYIYNGEFIYTYEEAYRKLESIYNEDYRYIRYVAESVLNNRGFDVDKLAYILERGYREDRVIVAWSLFGSRGYAPYILATELLIRMRDGMDIQSVAKKILSVMKRSVDRRWSNIVVDGGIDKRIEVLDKLYSDVFLEMVIGRRTAEAIYRIFLKPHHGYSGRVGIGLYRLAPDYEDIYRRYRRSGLSLFEYMSQEGFIEDIKFNLEEYTHSVLFLRCNPDVYRLEFIDRKCSEYEGRIVKFNDFYGRSGDVKWYIWMFRNRDILGSDTAGRWKSLLHYYMYPSSISELVNT